MKSPSNGPSRAASRKTAREPASGKVARSLPERAPSTRNSPGSQSAVEGARARRASIAKITEISAESSTSFEDAIREGIARATETLDEVRGAWVKEQSVVVEGGEITTYRVHLKLTFVLQD
jgi:flavin-binding protein dodecin